MLMYFTLNYMLRLYIFYIIMTSIFFIEMNRIYDRGFPPIRLIPI